MRQDQITQARTVLSYAVSYLTAPLLVWMGGAAGWVMALATWGLFTLLDGLTGPIPTPRPRPPRCGGIGGW